MSRIARGQLTGIGFHGPRRSHRPLAPRKLAFTHFIMTASLVLSIAVAATAVSIGIARAAVPADLATGNKSVTAIAAILSALIVLMGVITAAIALQPDETTQSD